MANFTPYNKRNGECPICGDTSGKCRTKSDNQGELILCMSLAGEAKGTIIDDYKCLGDTSDGNWAKFVPDNTTEWTQQQREEWRRERELKRQQNQQEEKQRQSESLSPEERDKLYQRILGSLSLSEEDRKDLIRRGFTNKQITQCGFKSVDQWQKLQGQYPHLLPGVNIHGDGLLTQRGYLCPVRNADGLITAMQVRLRVVTKKKDEPQESKKSARGGGRYRWLTSKTKKRPHGQSPHVYPQGKKELPLAVHYPLAIRKRQIGICEGTGVKPFLASQRLGMPVIGAAGGQFASSPLTFQESLGKVTQKIQKVSLNQVSKSLQKFFPQNPNKEDVELIIFPDAGDVQNPQVMRRWQKTFELLKEWQWKFKIAWWGQREKSTNPDIDELDDFTTINHITPAEFLGISQEYLTNPENLPTTRSFNPNFQGQKPGVHHSPEKQNWLNSKKFTPDIQLNQRYLDLDSSLIGLGKDLAICSGTGTGKTYWMVNKLLSLFSDKGMVAVGYRNSVLLQFNESAKAVGLNFYHLQTDLVGTKEKVLLSDPRSKIDLCSDSLLHIRPEDFDGKILILDEIQSIESHTLMSATAVSYQREKVKELLYEAINRAAMVIYLDGHLTDDTLAYLNSKRKHQRKLVKIRNGYTGNKGRVKFYLGGYNQKGEFSPHNHTELIERIKHPIAPIVVGSDSQKELEALDRILTQQGGNVFRFDSTTSTSKLAKEFLRNPKEFIIKNQITHLLYSPSGEAGMSVDIKGYFKEMFFLFYGVIDVDPCLQMMARVRDSEALTYVWVKPQGVDANSYHRDLLPEKLQTEILASVADLIAKAKSHQEEEELFALLKEQIHQARENSHEQRAIELKALHNYEQQNLRKCLYERIIASGYQIEECQGQVHDDSQRKEVKGEIALEKATRIFEADNITEAEANELKRKFDATQEEKDQVTKARLKNRLPGIENEVYETEEVIEKTPEQLLEELKNKYDPGSVEEHFLGDAHLYQENLTERLTIKHEIFTPEFIKLVLFDKRHHISRLEARWLYHNLDKAKKRERIKLSKKTERMLDPDEPDCLRRISPIDFKFLYLKLDKLKELGLDWFLVPGRTWDKNTPQVIEFWKRGKRKSSLKALGKKSAHPSPVAFVTECLRMLGYSTKRKGDGKTGRTYSLKDNHPMDNAIHKCAATRFETELRSDKAVVKFKQLAKMVAGKGSEFGTNGDDSSQKNKAKKSETLDSRNQSMNGLQPPQIFRENLNNNLGGVGKELDPQKSPSGCGEKDSPSVVLEPKIDPPTLDDRVTVEGQNLNCVVHIEPAELWEDKLINFGVGGGDLSPKNDDKNLEVLSSQSQSMKDLDLYHTSPENLNNNQGGVDLNFDVDTLVEGFKIAVARGRNFAVQQILSWSDDETELVAKTLTQRGELELIGTWYDLEPDIENAREAGG